jgi:hypothetical protein
VIALAGGAIALPTAGFAASGAGAGGAPRVAYPECRAATSGGTVTVAWIGLPGDGHAGGVTYQLEFSNISKKTCTLTGYPTVVAERGGHTVGKPAAHQGRPGAGTAPLAILHPGGTAHAVLTVTDAGALCTPVTATTLRVLPPGQSVAWSLPLTVAVCAKKVTMRVLPVAPSTGVPFLTTH